MQMIEEQEKRNRDIKIEEKK